VRGRVRSFILPLTAAGIIPAALLGFRFGMPSTARLAAGLPLVAVGLAMLAWTTGLFARVGRGTLAPWNPTRALVVVGPYAYVRNPMITGVATILAGESVVFGSWRIAAWAAAFVVINHVYFVLSEEPGLRGRFGADYDEYAKNVPRWLPRRTPWKQEAPDAPDAPDAPAPGPAPARPGQGGGKET
jgi:protein-S-isoprenylcysteine O-methyltransferase Ste14